MDMHVLPITNVRSWLVDAAQALLYDLGVEVQAVHDVPPPAPDDALTSRIRYDGDLAGALLVVSNEAFARTVSAGPDDLLSDFVGELSNQMLGRLKTRVVERGATIRLALPETARGQFADAPAESTSQWLRFETPAGDVLVRLDTVFTDEVVAPPRASEDAMVQDLGEGEFLLF